VGMLKTVITAGTGTGANIGRPAAGKTGTSQNWRDAWFVGFTPNLAAGVYIGYDDHDSLGRGSQAAVVAAPVFRDYMIAVLKNAPPTEFHIPPGLQMIRVNPDTMQAAGPGEVSVYFAYKPGTSPDKDTDIGLHGVPGETDTSASDNPREPMRGTGGLY